jgi:hypothetical protein
VILAYVYLLSGVVCLAVMLIAHFRLKPEPIGSLRQKFEELKPGYGTLRYRILNNVLAPLLAGMFVIVAWPVAIYLKAKELRGPKKVEAFGKTELQLDRDHLEEQWTIEQVEARETVADPLHAAPAVPFGFLNHTWKTFLAKRKEGDELWSYYALWMRLGTVREADFGYAWVRNGRPVERMSMGSYMVNVDKPPPEEDVKRWIEEFRLSRAREKAAGARQTRV